MAGSWWLRPARRGPDGSRPCGHATEPHATCTRGGVLSGRSRRSEERLLKAISTQGSHRQRFQSGRRRANQTTEAENRLLTAMATQVTDAEASLPSTVQCWRVAKASLHAQGNLGRLSYLAAHLRACLLAPRPFPDLWTPQFVAQPTSLGRLISPPERERERASSAKLERLSPSLSAERDPAASPRGRTQRGAHRIGMVRQTPSRSGRHPSVQAIRRLSQFQ